MTRTLTPRNELINGMIGVGISYWAIVTRVEADKHDNVSALILRDMEDNDKEYTLTRKMFTNAINEWTEQNRDHSYDFYARFSKDWRARDWDSVDWDVDITDQITQLALFGELRYS